MDVRMHYATQYFISMHAFVFGVLTVFCFVPCQCCGCLAGFDSKMYGAGAGEAAARLKIARILRYDRGKVHGPFLLQHCYISLFIPTKFLGMNTIPRNIALWSSTLRLTAAGVQMHPWLCQVASAQMPLMSLAPVLKAPFFFFQP